MIIMASAKTAYTAATLAAEFGTNGKELRKFLRTPDSGIAPVGKGARYNIELTAAGLKGLKKKFSDWSAAADSARADREAAKKSPVTDELITEVEVAEVDEVPAEELDFENMTDADIEAALDEIVAEGTDEA
jgi:hypothetical protein